MSEAGEEPLPFVVEVVSLEGRHRAGPKPGGDAGVRPGTMGPVRYRILGTTQALRADGTPVPVGGARLRALLTVLAVRAGGIVPAAFLVDEVWDGDPPADATGALQALVG